VLIGADPPVAWLQKVGIHFVDRPHQFQFGKSDDIVRRFVGRVVECPEDAARAAAQILGGSTGAEPARAAAAISLPMPGGGGSLVIESSAKGAKKWLRSATSIFSTRSHSQMTPMPQRPPLPPPSAPKGKKLDAPMPLSEFAKRQRGGTRGDGRRDQLTAGERTRILRMLRDEGGRIADEESQVHIGAAPPVQKNRDLDFDFDDDGVAPPPPPTGTHQRPDAAAKPALVVGLAQARSKRQSNGPVAQPPVRNKPVSVPPPASALQQARPPHRPQTPSKPPPPPPGRSKPPTQQPPMRRQPPPPNTPSSTFTEKTRALDPVRDAPPPPSLFDEPTRMRDINLDLVDQTRPEEALAPKELDSKFNFDVPSDNEQTRMASIDSIRKPSLPPPSRTPGQRAPAPRAQPARQQQDERTRAVDIRNDLGINDPSINDIDWDID